MLKMKLSFVVLVLVVALTSSIDPSKPLLTVYYESKCPDSRRFIIDQLVPTIREMEDYLQLKLVPFGKAHSINEGNSGFQCQHGPSECQGNIVQDCALDVMAGRPDVEKVNYVACEMQSLAGTTGNMQCVQNAHVPVSRVQQCVNSRQGIDLQLYSERLTNLVSPNFIPTITINGHFDQGTQDSAQHDLFRTLCALLPGIKPCAEHYNNNALQSLFN